MLQMFLNQSVQALRNCLLMKACQYQYSTAHKGNYCNQVIVLLYYLYYTAYQNTHLGKELLEIVGVQLPSWCYDLSLIHI